MAERLTNQVVMIIGASSGIGRETAKLFAKEGAKVMAAARREERLRTLQTELAGAGFTIEIGVADASKVEDMERLAEETRTKLGEPDILVYNTGTNIKDRALTALKPARWDMMVAVNMSGAFYATQAVLPGMRTRKSGHLIYVASISSVVPDVSGAAYQAAKRGLLGMAHAVRVEEKENGIRTCTVCPGLVDTERLENRPVKPTADMLSKALQPGDIAEAILAVAKLPPRAVVPEIQVLPTYL
jgi:NADP-dependent 3-hydroxy acid dehydrogenase YdfG